MDELAERMIVATLDYNAAGEWGNAPEAAERRAEAVRRYRQALTEFVSRSGGVRDHA